MTDQELREEFENLYNVKDEMFFSWFKKGYSLAQETIKDKDAEIENLKTKQRILGCRK